MKKHTLIILTLLYSTAAVNAQTQVASRPAEPLAVSPALRIGAGTQVVGSDNVHLVLNNNYFVNNGTYTDSTGTLEVKGTVNQSGAGVSLFKNIKINAGGTLNLTTTIKTIGAVTNSGTFSPGASSVEYIADGDQNIASATYATLKISGSGKKTLSGNVNITTGLDLGGTAKLVTDTYLVTLKGSSSAITGATYGAAATSWIVTGDGGSDNGIGGLVIENIGTTGRTSAVTFPIGPTTSLYNPVQLTNVGTTDNFTVAVNNQPVPGATAANAVKSTWLISEAVAGGTNATIATQWIASQEGASFLRNNSKVVHSTGSAIDYSGTEGAADGSSPYTISGTGFTSFSPFGVISTGVILPVKLLNFGLQQQTGKVILQWQTAQETSSKNYTVQHSTDGINYTNIGTLPASANNNGINNYSFTDTKPAEGHNYYRLQMNDIDGKVSYSSIQTTGFAISTSSFSVKTNPATNGNVQLQVNTSNNFVLQGLDGKIIFKGKLATGMNTIDVRSCSKGIYLLRSGNQTERILIK